MHIVNRVGVYINFQQFVVVRRLTCGNFWETYSLLLRHWRRIKTPNTALRWSKWVTIVSAFFLAASVFRNRVGENPLYGLRKVEMNRVKLLKSKCLRRRISSRPWAKKFIIYEEIQYGVVTVDIRAIIYRQLSPLWVDSVFSPSCKQMQFSAELWVLM